MYKMVNKVPIYFVEKYTLFEITKNKNYVR